VRTLLINPPVALADFEAKRAAQPLGLAYYAAWLRDVEKQDVRILDCVQAFFDNEVVEDGLRVVGYDLESTAAVVEEFRPDRIGFSFLFSDHYWIGERFARALKARFPDMKFSCGGVHPTMAAMQPDDLWDEVVWGEADNPSHSDILDTLPLPARDLLDMEGYWSIGQAYREKNRGRNITMMTSRGCPAHCTFCSSNQMMGRYRFRGVGAVISEMRDMIDRYGAEEFFFIDDNLTGDMPRARDLFRAMIPLGIQWYEPNGQAIHKLDDELIDLIAESGCYKVTLAFETGTEKTMKQIRKPLKIDVEADLRKIERFKKLGLRAEGLFVIGWPWETKEDVLETVRFSQSMGLDYVTYPLATPFPGTAFLKQCEENGWLIEGQTLRDLKFGINNIRTPHWDSAWIETLRKNEWMKYNHPEEYAKQIGAQA
jgi:anaerobic magnesium-protoporphyrin IX monomethyl ester cyclase